MKAQLLSIALFCFATVLFTSCDPNELDDKSNYWNSSTLVRLKLNDKVKTITYNDNAYKDEFNQDGFITKSTYTSGDMVSTTIHNYDSEGKLTSTDFTSTGSAGNASYSTVYSYNNAGRYIVQQPFHVMISGLVPNLSGVVTQYGKIDYIFQGDNMLLIQSNTYENTTYTDTTVVKYNGKYPVSLTTKYSFAKDMTYASNGMFKTYTEGFQGPGYYDERKYYFKADDTFLLEDSVVFNYTSETSNTKSVMRYTYDSKKNVIAENNNGSLTEHTYTYDSHNNWTTKTTRYKDKDSSVWQNGSTETRTITYW